MNDLISIIVPIYNTQKYLKKCIDSILHQTYRNLEIILIDDGSTDQSGKICDKFEEKNSCIKVIHQKNKGLSAARNSGIEMANGKYVIFLDSDDYIAENMIEELYQLSIKHDADLSICNFQYVNEVGEKIENIESPIEDNLLSTKEAIEKLFIEQNWYYVVAWNKLYKKELWDDIRYPIGYIHEDEAIVHHIFGKCKKIVTTKQKLLFYRQVNNSIMHNVNVKRVDKYYALADRLVFLEKQVSKENIRTLSYQFWYHYLEDFFTYYPEKANKKYIGRMRKALYTAMPVMARCGFLTKKDTISLRIFLFSPTLYKKLFMK